MVEKIRKLVLLAFALSTISTYSAGDRPEEIKKNTEIYFSYLASLLWDPTPRFRLPGPLREDLSDFLTVSERKESLEQLMTYPEYRSRVEQGSKIRHAQMERIDAWTAAEAKANGLELDPWSMVAASFESFMRSRRTSQRTRTEAEALNYALDKTPRLSPQQADVEIYNFRQNLNRGRQEEVYGSSISAESDAFERWKKKVYAQYLRMEERTFRNAMAYYAKRGGKYVLSDGENSQPIRSSELRRLVYRSVILPEKLHFSDAPVRTRTLVELGPEGLPVRYLGWTIESLIENSFPRFDFVDFDEFDLFNLPEARRAFLAEALNLALGRFPDGWKTIF